MPAHEACDLNLKNYSQNLCLQMLTKIAFELSIILGTSLLRVTDGINRLLIVPLMETNYIDTIQIS